ncbi:hypothetical protein PRIPAC_90247 [Pristionchus pacificus]|uniref:Uncharacterized protein n=1 Tax=Pristionchus pacificus TaxID=54126 RepID=A0A2A6B5M5_PRIPA|nr:hypothetical protein PRIPAC_90247 [Pristionchus pacificus]|eukprot:PDM61158.1 hypothetical protein PRIPAC_50600 [Pristionchus pacificus]
MAAEGGHEAKARRKAKRNYIFIAHVVCSICFVKENTTKRFNYIGNIKGSDEYRCRITCAEREECQSFGVVGNHCTMYGASRFHWVDVHEECGSRRHQMKQPLITDLYYPSLAIKYFTDLDEFEMEFNTWQACPKGCSSDVFNHIHWNGSIGAWILTKKTAQSKDNTTIYIRAARCFLIQPKLHTESCFGTLPTIPTGQVKAMIVSEAYCAFCTFITDFDTRRNATYLRDQVLVCVDRSWMFLQLSGSTIIAAWRILRGICTWQL